MAEIFACFSSVAPIFSAIGGFVGALPKIKEGWLYLSNQFSYLFRYDELIQSLSDQVKKRDEKRAGLQQRVDAERRNLQVIDPDVLEWLESAKQIKQDSEKIIGAVPEDQNGDSENLLDAVPEDQNVACLNWMCPNLKLRYCQSLQATKLTAAAVELLEKFDKFQTISYPPPPIGIEAIPAPSGIQEFQSRKDIEEEIMACLKNDTIFMIGVCGMGGVGKTTMAKKICRMASEEKICRRASEEKLFEEIVIAEGLGEEADQLKIQQRIAKGLGLELTNDTITNCARLLQRLKGKNVLLVLDDVWKKLDLEELGISSQNMNKGCKIILTIRNDRVCIESTNDPKIIYLGVLCKEEAWSLFRDKAGRVVDQDDLRELAIDVAEECKGLPLALATVGSALKHRTNMAAVLRDALSELRHSAPINIPGVLKDVYQPLQLSYKALESDEARHLFLLCCLFPEDSEIILNDLVHYGIGLGIFSNIRNLREARDRVCVLVDTLKSRFLLMDASSNADYPRVKMHDVVRDMAIWISSQGTEITLAKHVLFKVSHEIGLSEWPIKDSCENYTAISLTFGQSMVIPKECMNCPRLEALLVRRNYSDEAPKLPDTFFNRMSGLRLLSIYKCIVPSSSLSLLTQLRVLRLYYCGLKMISVIGELVNLEVLILPGSDIVELPDEMGALTKLKLLDLNYCCNLKKIAPGVISRLVQLEELSILGSDIVELPDEMGALTKLKLLNLNRCGNLKKIAPNVISRLVQLEELRLRDCPIEWEGEEKGKERSNASVVEVFSLRNLRALEIWIKDPPQVIPQDRGGQLEQELTSYHVRIGESAPDLYSYQKRMSINVDENIKSFVNSMRVLLMGAEYLRLKGKGSKGIIEVLERQGFQNVKELEISSLDTAKHLATALIQGDIAPTHSIGSAIFPVLRRLHLKKMDDLEEICDAPPPVGSFSKLEEIHLSNLPGLMYLWKCSNEKLCLPNLKKIYISDCEKLKWVFPLSIAESLCQLETIDIVNCPNMEEVFFKDEISQGSSSEEGGDSDHMSITFPKLEKMILRHLPKLSALCSKAVDVFEFPSITILDIFHVSWPDLFKKEIIGEFENLEILRLCSPDIAELPDEMGALTKLKLLDLNECRNLKKIAPGVISRLVQLEDLGLYGCPIEWEGEEKGKERSNASVVEVFSLSNLRALKIWIKDPQVIPHDRGGQLGQELTRYHVTIGERIYREYTYQKRMQVFVDEMRKSFVNSMCVLFLGAEFLYLKGKGSKDIIEVLERQGFQNVKWLCLEGMDDLEEICHGPPTLGSFSKLEEIEFYKLPGLTYLWKCSNEKLCLPNLKWIWISECSKLKWVFPLSIAESLCQLETISIQDCPNMEEVFFKDEISQGSSQEGSDSDHMNIHPPPSSSSSTVLLPKLQYLRLLSLPQLENKNCKAISIIFDSIKEIWVGDCPKLKRLPLYIPMNNINTTNAGNGQTSSSAPPNTLERIFGSKEWWESLEWDHYPPNSKAALLPFFKPTDSNDDSNDDSDDDFI